MKLLRKDIGGLAHTALLDTLDNSVRDSPVHTLQGVLDAVGCRFAQRCVGGEEACVAGDRLTEHRC